MERTTDLLKKSYQFVKEGKYNKALSCYKLFKFFYPELSDIVTANEVFLRKRVSVIDEDSALIMEIPTFDNQDYLVKKFWEVIFSTPYDVKIDIISGSAENSFLLAWFNTSEILRFCIDFNHDKQETLKLFFKHTTFFDSVFYKNQYKIVTNSEDSLYHYIQTGFAEGKLPARWFDLHVGKNTRIRAISEKNSEKNVSNNTHKPKISILVPVFNNSKFLNECIESILNQTLSDIEIIIINDGSTEKKSVEILEQYAQSDDRIRLIHKKNTGYGHSMNCGLLSAKGEYIGIVESDDYIMPEMYENLYLNSNNGEIDIIKSNPSFFYGNGKERCFTRIKLHKNNGNIVFSAKDYPAYFRAIPLNPIGIFKKSFLKKEDIFFSETPGASFQDIGFYFKTSVTAKKIKLIDKQYYMVRRDNENSSVFAKDKFEYTVYEYEQLYDFLERDKARKEQFITLYNLRKFFSYKFTYERIASEHKNTFKEIFYREISSAILKNEINKDLFIPSEIEWLKENLKINIPENPPLFSVIIPVYNSEDTIADTLNSLIHQTLYNIEIICINDGSIDNSIKILDDFASKDSRIRVFNQENLCAGNARNKGLDISRGKYLVFADSDDYFEVDCLKNFYNFCEEEHLDLCICKLKLQSVRTGKVFDCRYNIREDVLKMEKPFTYKDIREDRFRAIMGWAVDKVFKADFVKNYCIRFKETRIHNDLNFVFTAFIKANRIGILNKKLICKTVFNDKKLTNQKGKYFRTIKDVLLELKQTLIDSEAMPTLCRDFLCYTFHLIAIYDATLKDSLYYEDFKSFVRDELLPYITHEKIESDYFWDKDDYNAVSKFIL